VLGYIDAEKRRMSIDETKLGRRKISLQPTMGNSIQGLNGVCVFNFPFDEINFSLKQFICKLPSFTYPEAFSRQKHKLLMG
jgi:hypothetical protein